MPPTILLIDDSVPIHRIIKAHLKPDKLTLHSAHDGEAGLAAALRLLPSLILLDLDLPGIDGFEVCRRLKDDPTTAATPVVLMSANSTMADKVKGLELGAIDYLTKPFKPLELRARARAALRAVDQLEVTTMVDAVTGLWNRAYLELHLKRYFSLATRTGSPLACIVMDLEPFTPIGGNQSNPDAGELMRSAGQIILKQCRAEDVLCRWDEWKFVILLTGSSCASAALMVDRLRPLMVRELRPRREQTTPFTCACGVSDTHGANEATILDRAAVAAAAARRAANHRAELKRAKARKLHVVA